MRKLTLIFAFILFTALHLFAQKNLFWVNGAGNWNDVAHWATTSGGVGGANIPTKNNNVFIDANSALTINDVIKIKNAAIVNNLEVLTPVTIKGNKTIEIYGSIKVSEKADIHKFKGDIVFASSQKQTIDIPVKLNSNIVFNGKNGSWKIESDIITRKDIYLEKGNVNTNDKTIEAYSFVATGNSNRGLELGKSEIITKQWDVSSSNNLNINPGTSLIRVANYEKSFKSGGLNYNLVTELKPGAKAISSINTTITDALCYTDTDPGDGSKEDGNLNVAVAPAGSYYITIFSQSTGTEVGRATGNNLDFTLPPGTYTVRVSETGYNQNYTTKSNQLVGQPAAYSVTIEVNTDVSCPDGNDLSLKASETGGTSSYTYNWSSNGNPAYSHSTKTTPAELGIANYVVTVTDNNGCEVYDNFYYYPLNNGNNEYLVDDGRPDNISISNVTSIKSCEGSSNGSITVGTVTGGTPSGTDYYYGVEVAGVPSYGTLGTKTISNLSPGDYIVWVKDVNNCEKKYGTVTVGENPLPVAPTSVSASSTTICAGESTTLSYTGGSGDTFKWYSSSCGVTSAGTGNNLSVSPAATTTYYGRWETSSCGNSTCQTVTVTVNPLPVAPTSVSATPTTICAGASTTLSYTGGSGTTFEWYSASCGGTSVGTGNNLIVAPTVTTTYYGRWQNGCGNSTCQTVTVTVNPQPVAPTSVSATPATICSGSSTTLSYTGGLGDTFEWYTGSCGGSSAGTGNNLSVSPAATTTYYGRWENGCGNSTCQTVTVTVNPLPIAPTSVSATPATICEGTSTTLSYTGGSGTTFAWYSASCGGTSVGTGNNLSVSPTVTTTYYGRWETNSCGNSTCQTITVNVNPLPIAPTSVSATPTEFCVGGSTTLSYAGGSGTTFAWYTVSCGGSSVGTGNNLSVTPGVTTTYYGRWENSCGNSTCQTITVTVNPLPVAPTSVSAAPATICAGASTTLSYTGGSGDTFAWFTSSCGGTSAGTGNNLSVSPAITTTYYGRWETNNCGNSTCQTVTVTVNPLPVAPTSVSATPATICAGASTTLSYTGGSGTTFEWYTTSCGGTSVGTGNNLIVAPTVTTTYYGRWQNGCGNSTCQTVTVTVNPQPIAPTSVSATPATICAGSSTTLSYTGGLGDTFAWYTGSCGGSSQGTGNNLSVSPAVTTTYYGRWETNSCGNSTCQTVTVTVNPLPVAPTSVSATPATICAGASTTLSYTGGSGTTFEWYITSCGGTSVGTGNNLIVAPTITTTYYGRWQNGCGNSTCQTVAVTVVPAPEPYAGVDTTLCYDAYDYTVSDAFANNNTTLSWINSTTGDGTGFDDDEAQNPTYTISDADRAASTVTLTMTVSNATCANVSDEMIINLAPELIASVGGLSPYLIDTTHTEINVSFWVNHPDISQLAFYLVAPDGFTELKLYSYNSATDGCDPWDIWTNTIDSLTFSLNTGTSSGAFNLCDFKESANPIEGEYDATDYWSIFEGFDPAEGGWSLRIEDTFGGSEGYLTKALITFLDTNQQGDNKYIVFASGDINYPIKDNSSTTYTVPIGLRTNCYGECDARAIASAIGGTPPFNNYEWSNGLTNDTVDLCGGDHWVVVTDAKGCTDTAFVSVLEPDPIVIAFDSTNISCFGDSTGMVRVNASDGAGGFTYLWDDGDNSITKEVDSLPAGTYTVTVTDKNNCNTIGSVTITQPLAPLSITNIIIDSTDCNNQTGTITITPTGGTPATVTDAYTFKKDGAPTANPITPLAVGNYVITITDSLLCSLDTTITMVDKGDMVITGFTMVNPISCAGTCDGEVRVDFENGAGSFTFDWSGGGLIGTDDTLPDVCGDSTYTVIITDANTCSTTDFYTIPHLDSLKISKIDSTDVLCFGDSTGMAEVEGVGGTAPYTYIWTVVNGDTISQIDKPTNLPYGYNFINITDAYLCSVDDSIFIDQPTVLTATKDSTQTGCGVSTGSVVVTPSGGTPFAGLHPYNYLWDDVAATTDSIAIDLPAGIYNVTVSDFNGCELYESVTVIDNSDLEVILDSTKNILCAGSTNGAAYITVNNGLDPITYLWSNGETAQDALALGAGTHYVTVTDANTCSMIIEAVITQPDSLKATHNIINEPLCYGDATGTAAVTPTGGTEPYSYLWPDGQTDSLAVNLLDGNYIVTITDANGCDTVETVVLTQPDSITFAFEFTPTNCGGSVGTMNVTDIKGGTGVGTYTTNWASPDWDNYPAADTTYATDTIRNLWVANYVAIVTDANGCTVRDSMNMTDTSSMTITLDYITNVLCNGANNGAILVHGTNGEKPYKYLWETGDTDSLLNDAFAGNYNIVVEDANQCKRDTSFTITEPDAITNQWVFTDSIVCVGKDSVSFYALITGGVNPYSYLWKNSMGEQITTDSNLVHAKPDWYYLTVVDNNNCTYLDSIHIFEPEPITLAITQGKTTCPDSTGWAKVTVTGGVAPYAYNWYLESNPSQIIEGQNTDSASKLWVDIFVVQVIDSLGCEAYDTIIIGDDSGLDFDFTIEHHVLCEDICDGKAFINFVTHPDSVNPLVNYTALWSDGYVGDTNKTLCIGTHTITITENTKGCKKIDTVIITDKDALKYSLSHRDNYTQSDNFCLGSATIRPTAGDTMQVDKYYVDWFDAGMTQVGETDTIRITDGFSIKGGLCEGLYYVTLKNNRKDGETCMQFDSVYISRDTLNYDTIQIINVACYGDTNGYIEIMAQGGSQSGYQYTWGNDNWDIDSTRNIISNLSAGDYYLTITDDINSIIYDTIEITQPDTITFDFIYTATSCIDSTGEIYVANVLGGTGVGTYSTSWASPDWEGYPVADSVATDTIRNLWIANYTAIITDGNGCIVRDSMDLPDNSNFSIDAKSIGSELCYGTSAGSEIITGAKDGVTPYVFNWVNESENTIANTDTVKNIQAGVYIAHVADNEGCKRVDTVEVTQFDNITFEITDTVFNHCYTDSTGSFVFSNVSGGINTGFTYWLLDSDKQPVIGPEDNPLFDTIPVNKYYLRVYDNYGCKSDDIPFTFLSESPQIIPEFKIIDSATCNNYSYDGKMAVIIEMGYFNQVSPTWNDEVITYSYRWDNNPAHTNDTLENALAGNHFVKVTDNLGCDNTFDTIMPHHNYILIDNTYVLNSGLSKDYICPYDTVAIFANVTGADSVIWNNTEYIIGAPNRASVDVASRTSQEFVAEARIYYNLAENKYCADRDTVIVGRYTIDTLIAYIQDDEEKIFVGNEIVLKADKPEVTYTEEDGFNVTHKFTWSVVTMGDISWDPSPPDTNVVIARPMMDANFTVYDTIIIDNDIYSTQKCILYDTSSIIVLPEFDPPKGFSPNGDGVNELWKLPGINGYDNVTVQVFNRWGGLVWEHNNGNYEGNEWNGESMKGKQLPSGTYYFIIKYSDNDMGTQTLTGPISIIR